MLIEIEVGTTDVQIAFKTTSTYLENLTLHTIQFLQPLQLIFHSPRKNQLNKNASRKQLDYSMAYLWRLPEGFPQFIQNGNFGIDKMTKIIRGMLR